jgi:hypothetical protein
LPSFVIRSPTVHLRLPCTCPEGRRSHLQGRRWRLQGRRWRAERMPTRAFANERPDVAGADQYGAFLIGT